MKVAHMSGVPVCAGGASLLYAFAGHCFNRQQRSVHLLLLHHEKEGHKEAWQGSGEVSVQHDTMIKMCRKRTARCPINWALQIPLNAGKGGRG